MIENEVSPSDLFCYLHTRFGPPNDFQNFLRGDTSDNLIHWQWTFRIGGGILDIQGMNFCTCILFIGDIEIEDGDLNQFVTLIKADFQNHAKGMSECRKSFEYWIEFVNPYQRLRRAIEQLTKELSSLKVTEINEPPSPLSSSSEQIQKEILKQWNDASIRLNKAFGICFGIRSMLPVMAEAFINLILYLLMRPEIKSDNRLRENAFKQPIDVRVKSLSINCDGFKHTIDYSNPVCSRYHSLVNERNDLLHGNININKLRFNEVYFLGRVPIFKKYQSMWDRAFVIQKESVGLDKVEQEIGIVTEFIDYILSRLNERKRTNVEQVISRLELGLHQKDDRVGVLFPEHIVDFRMRP